MDSDVLLKGLLIGFSIAAPVGPIGVLCIRRTLAEGRASGLISGLGAATADAVYGCVAGFGLTFIASFLISGQHWLRLFGGLFLLYLGTRTFLTAPAKEATPAGGKGLAGAFASTFFLTLTNPLTILSFGAVFAGLGVASENHGYTSAFLIVFGVFAGSTLWWFILSLLVSLFRNGFTPQRMKWVNRSAGVLINLFGGIALLSLWRR
jgi:threonine/homoserine/homoserine lactone efflux protein